jgi:DNA-directed RNA polymerase subunit E'/Rpb7
LNSDFLASKTSISFENIIEVVGTFNQEGLGPIKWWQNQ